MTTARSSAAVRDDVSIWDWLSGFGNMDDKIGSEVIQFTSDELMKFSPAGIPFSWRFTSNGEWVLSGRASALR